MDPPHFRRGDESSLKACEWCQHFSGVDYCKKYERMMLPMELCDSFKSTMLKGKGQLASK